MLKKYFFIEPDRFILLMVTILISSISWAQALTISASDLKRIVEEKNSDVKAWQLEKEATQERDGYLLRSFLPSLELHTGHEQFKMGREQSKSQPFFGAAINVNLFNGLRDQLESDIRTLAAEKKSIQYKRQFSEELFKARSLFWNILFLQKQIDLLEEAKKINTQNLKAAQRRSNSGVSLETDRFDFEMKAVDLQRETEELKLNLAQLESEFAVLINISSETRFNFNSAFQHEHDFEKNLNYSEKDIEFLFKEDELLGETQDLKSRKEGHFWWPRLDAYAGWNQYNEREEDFTNSRDRQETVVGVKLTLNLADGFESTRESNALRKEALALKLQHQNKKNIVLASLSTEIKRLNLLHTIVHDAEENILRAEKYYKLTQAEYSRGVKNSPDVLGASEKLWDSKKKYFEIIKDFQISKNLVLKMLGR